MGKDLFIQHGPDHQPHGHGTGFQRYYPEYRVHAVNFPGDPYPIHIDATFVPLRPGLIINNPHRKLPEEQRAIFEANDWQIVEARPAGPRRAAGAVLQLGVAVHELPRARPQDGHRGGLRGLPAGADGQARHERHPPATCATPTRSAAACTAPRPTSTARASASTTSRTASRIPPWCARRCGTTKRSCVVSHAA